MYFDSLRVMLSPVSRRSLLKAGLAVPAAAVPVLGTAGCGPAAVIAAPIARYAVQAVISAFAAKAVDAASEKLGPVLSAAVEKLQHAVGEALTDVWAAQISPRPGDIVAAALYGKDRVTGRVLQPFGQEPPALPVVVQIGLALHASFIMEVRSESNWHGWGDLNRQSRLESLRRELLVVRSTRISGDEDVTEESKYLCLIAGGDPAKNDFAKHNNNIEISWKPSAKPTQQSTIVVRRGNVPDDYDDARWEPGYEMPTTYIPFDRLFVEAS